VPPHNFELHYAISEDIANGWIWVETSEHDLASKLEAKRRVARVSHGAKAIFCEVIHVDDYDLERFNHFYEQHGVSQLHRGVDGKFQRAERVFINHWYRRKLGIEVKAGESLLLNIAVKSNPHAQARACIQHHPQLVVRIATWLGVVALGLGLLGVGLAAFPLADQGGVLACHEVLVQSVGGALCAFGIGLPVYGTVFLLLARR
jgi:hypothetical protein